MGACSGHVVLMQYSLKTCFHLVYLPRHISSYPLKFNIIISKTKQPNKCNISLARLFLTWIWFCFFVVFFLYAGNKWILYDKMFWIKSKVKFQNRHIGGNNSKRGKKVSKYGKHAFDNTIVKTKNTNFEY